MRLIKQLFLASGLFAAIAAGGAASAGALVQCNIADVGGVGRRWVEVNPALVGGQCYTQEGNLQESDYPNIAAGIVEVDKDTTVEFPTGDNSEGALQFTRATDQSGGWSYNASLWDTYDRLWIAFHFGNGGGSPDSFAVELDPFDAAGTYALFAGPDAGLNGLSNIYLLGVLCSPTTPNCNCPPNDPDCGDTDIPEPGTLLLLGAAALGLATRRRLFG